MDLTIKIIYWRRSMYQAIITLDTGQEICGNGNCRDEAVGNLIRTYQELIGGLTIIDEIGEGG